MEDFQKRSDELEASLTDSNRERRMEPTFDPIHVVYGGADRFTSQISSKFGNIALGLLDSVARDEEEFSAVFEGCNGPSVPAGIFSAVAEKLTRQPIEDFRIDFEDGFGFRSDLEEDTECSRVAEQLVIGMESGSLPPMIGIRIKSFQSETYKRATRTLGLCLGSLLERSNGKLPPGFVITLPKVRKKEEVYALSELLSIIESRFDLETNAVKLELMAETPEAVLDIDNMVNASPERITSVHFGAYDLTAELGITANHQDINHPASEFAKQFIQFKLAGSGVRLSDSVTKQIPSILHKGRELSQSQLTENKESLKSGLVVHFENVAHSMKRGYFQSWDLHPGQLIARYAAVFSFFSNEAEEQGKRLRAFLDKATQATLTGNVFDDAATAQGYLNFFRRAHSCGALDGERIQAFTGLTTEKLLNMSFNETVEL